jgi:hypothetical protein
LARTARNFICSKNNSSSALSKRSVSKNLRNCLRKGCANRFSPQRRYQRFCNEPLCSSELNRWRALKRQRRYRANPNNRHKQAERERLRRLEKAKAAKQSGGSEESPSPKNYNRAWSRKTAVPKNFCDRPGCYDPKVESTRNTPKYCGNSCRSAAHRVQHRDRKYHTARYQWPKSSRHSPVNYSGSLQGRIPFPPPKRSNQHGSEASSQSRSRSPPSQM